MKSESQSVRKKKTKSFSKTPPLRLNPPSSAAFVKARLKGRLLGACQALSKGQKDERQYKGK
jgi:hypothetical protein